MTKRLKARAEHPSRFSAALGYAGRMPSEARHPAPDPRSDADLIAALNAPGGDPGAFEALYLRHRDWVARVARRYAPPTPDGSHDAEDIAQEVFLAFLRRFPGFRLTSRLTTFLYPIAKNAALARARRREVELRLNPTTARAEAAPIDRAPRGSESAPAALRTALDRLPLGQREVLLMRAVDEMTLEEIGLALAIPVGTVKSRLHAALQTLRADPAARGYFDGRA